jgi:transposase-like protein
MKEITKRRKKAKEYLSGAFGSDWMSEQMRGILLEGKQALDACALELGRRVAESVMYLEREELSGPDYRPIDSGTKKWASQKGSIYIGGQKIFVDHPRLRGSGGEIALKSYQVLKDPTQFSQELLTKVLRGLSGRRYRETLASAAGALGISAGSISNRIVEATARQMAELLERDLSGIELFALFLDTVHRGGVAFIVALGLDAHGDKQTLGFWEGATENHAICEALLSDLESRGLKLGPHILFATDGGGGINKTLRNRYGDNLVHQRCTIHKDRNIQAHLPKRYRKEAHRRFRNALALKTYDDAKTGLLVLEKWLREINESSADSLLEALEEILTLHRLKVPELLRKALHSTNAIESVFSQVRRMEKNIQRYRSSRMSRRWLATCLLDAEKHFRKVKGHRSIPEVIKNIAWEQQKKEMKEAA